MKQTAIVLGYESITIGQLAVRFHSRVTIFVLAAT